MEYKTSHYCDNCDYLFYSDISLLVLENPVGDVSTYHFNHKYMKQPYWRENVF